MHLDRHIGFSDADAATLAEIVHDVECAQAALTAAQAAHVHALARADDLARRLSERATAKVRERDMALRAIAAEIAGVLRTSDRTTQREIGDAATLVEHYPHTLEAWKTGLITRGHLRLITELGTPLPPEARATFESIAIPVCEHDTPDRVKSRLQIVAARLHPRTFTERHHEAREGRGVRVIDVGDGMSDIIATLPTAIATAIYDRLTAQARTVADARQQARQQRGVDTSGDADACGDADPSGDAGSDSPVIPRDVVASDNRTTDQIRADVLADMLLTSSPEADPTRDADGPGALGAIRAKVQVVVPALTLLGADDGPVDLVGHAPIDAETARGLAGATRHPLERILTDPVTGSVVEVDTYQRPASLDRYLRARDRHCRFPGCRLAAVRCEVDHTLDHARGGRTRRSNLAHLCQRHHSMKQFARWRVRQRHGGVLEWTSPLGRPYIDRPPSAVAFVPVLAVSSADPPPF